MNAKEFLDTLGENLDSGVQQVQIQWLKQMVNDSVVLNEKQRYALEFYLQSQHTAGMQNMFPIATWVNSCHK